MGDCVWVWSIKRDCGQRVPLAAVCPCAMILPSEEVPPGAPGHGDWWAWARCEWCGGTGVASSRLAPVAATAAELTALAREGSVSVEEYGEVLALDRRRDALRG